MMTFSPGSRFEYSTLAANPLSMIEIGIRTIKQVAALAVSFGRIFSSGAITSKRIDLCRHSFKVIRPHTGFVAAEVIQLQMGRYRPIDQLIGEAMSANLLLSHPETAIPIMEIARPNPTSLSFHDSEQEPDEWSLWNRAAFQTRGIDQTSFEPMAVVRLTPTTGMGLMSTFRNYAGFHKLSIRQNAWP